MNIILAIIILGFLVAIHEFGHFVVAKISGMYVTTFSIGMGPKIASFQKGETEYVISAIPAGGFVSVKGITSDPEIDDDPDDPRLFQNRPILHRMLFTVAGPFMNFLTALVALFVFYLALGVNVVDNDSPPIIAEVSADSAAEAAGLAVGDEILSINGQTMQTWEDFDSFMASYKSGEMDILYSRDGATAETTLTPAYNDQLNRYALGVTKQRTITKIVLRTALPGIVSGAILAVARVIGETAPLLMTAGYIASTNVNLFSGQMTTLPVYVYQEYSKLNANCPASADASCVTTIPMERAWAAALVLILIVLILNLIGRLVAKIFAVKSER